MASLYSDKSDPVRRNGEKNLPCSGDCVESSSYDSLPSKDVGNINKKLEKMHLETEQFMAKYPRNEEKNLPCSEDCVESSYDRLPSKDVGSINKKLEKMHLETEKFMAKYPIGPRTNSSDFNENVSCDHGDWKKVDVKSLLDGTYLDLKMYLTEVCCNPPFVDTEVELVIHNLIKPIGVSLLHNGNLVIGERVYRNSVGIFDCITGKRIASLKSDREFESPSDMVALPDGRLIVRDDLGLQMFDEEGTFIKSIIPEGEHKLNGVCYGVKCDPDGHLITISTNPNDEKDCITRKGETDILIIDMARNCILQKIELVEVIKKFSKEFKKSKCRFLACDVDNIYITDLGLNKVYVINRQKTSATKFGRPGFGPGQFRDAAGIAVDSVGNIIVSDAGNNRLQIFDKQRNFLGFIKLNAVKVSRPSGIYLDTERKVLYILNLRANSLFKLAIVKNE